MVVDSIPVLSPMAKDDTVKSKVVARILRSKTFVVARILRSKTFVCESRQYST
jgi:hypothetical protein